MCRTQQRCRGCSAKRKRHLVKGTAWTKMRSGTSYICCGQRPRERKAFAQGHTAHVTVNWILMGCDTGGPHKGYEGLKEAPSHQESVGYRCLRDLNTPAGVGDPRGTGVCPSCCPHRRLVAAPWWLQRSRPSYPVSLEICFLPGWSHPVPGPVPALPVPHRCVQPNLGTLTPKSPILPPQLPHQGLRSRLCAATLGITDFEPGWVFKAWLGSHTV
jgi:hypothetical protein